MIEIVTGCLFKLPRDICKTFFGIVASFTHYILGGCHVLFFFFAINRVVGVVCVRTACV